MSEWLDLMLDEIARKKREEREAREEAKRRGAAGDKKAAPREPKKNQSK